MFVAMGSPKVSHASLYLLKERSQSILGFGPCENLPIFWQGLGLYPDPVPLEYHLCPFWQSWIVRGRQDAFLRKNYYYKKKEKK